MKRIIKFSLPVGLLAIFVMLLSGCKMVDHFSPNTMVKTYQLLTGDGRLDTEFYDVRFRIRARVIGNKVGVDNYLVNLELTSKDKVEPKDVGVSIPSVRLTTLTISLPGGDDIIVIGRGELENPPEDSEPQIFRNHVYYNFNARDVLIPGEPEKIVVTAELQYSYASQDEAAPGEKITAEFQFSKEMKWFKTVN